MEINKQNIRWWHHLKRNTHPILMQWHAVNSASSVPVRTRLTKGRSVNTNSSLRDMMQHDVVQSPCTVLTPRSTCFPHTPQRSGSKSAEAFLKKRCWHASLTRRNITSCIMLGYFWTRLVLLYVWLYFVSDNHMKLGIFLSITKQLQDSRGWGKEIEMCSLITHFALLIIEDYDAVTSSGFPFSFLLFFQRW